MKRMMSAIGAITLVLGVAACGGREDNTDASASAGTIDGTWTLNLDSAKWDNSNSKYSFMDGTYTCDSCLPPFSVAADGQWQSVDRPGVDELKYTIVDDMTIETASRLGGKDLGSSTWKVSEDGQTMTIDWTNLDGTETVTGQSVLTRVAAGPEGSHAASGEWAPQKVANMSDAGRTITFALDGDTLTQSGNGFGYTATLGGDPVPVEGSNTGEMVAVERMGDNGFKETFTRDGETVNIVEITVDGDTISAKSSDPRDGSSVSWTATRSK